LKSAFVTKNYTKVIICQNDIIISQFLTPEAASYSFPAGEYKNKIKSDSKMIVKLQSGA